MASIGPPALGAKGCVERLHPTGETTHYDLCVAGASANHVRCASLRSGGPPIGGQDRDGASYRCSAPYTLLPLRGISPQGETRDMREKTASHILQVPFRRFPPLVAGALWTSPAGLRVDGPLGRRFLRGLSLTAAMPLRVVEGASKFIEGALL